MKRIISISRLLVTLLCIGTAIAQPELKMELAPDTLMKEILPSQSLLDEIIVVVYGPERTRVICRSEIERLSIDGRRRGLEDVIFEELLYQETIKFKVPVDDSVIDKYIASLRKEHNLSLDDIKMIFRNSGYSYEEGREQLRLMYAANSMLEHKITSRLIVPRDEVTAYYTDNPDVKEAKYQIQVAYVPFDADIAPQEQQTALETSIKQAKNHQLNWHDPFWLKQSEIAQNIQFVVSMQEGDVSKPQLVDGGFEVYRVQAIKPERVVPLEKRYKQIEESLRMPRYKQLLAEYKAELFNAATIVRYTAPEPVAA